MSTELEDVPKMVSSTEHSQKVANHYNTIEEKGLSHRNQSRILYLRNFNNWMKSIMFQKYLDPISESKRWGDPLRAIDLACGKGGDLFKWQKANCSHVVFTDIAEKSIEDCRSRFESGRSSGRRMTAEFIVMDLTKERLRQKLRDPSMEVDFTSCQFALHYAFESLPQAEQLLLNASDCLRVGGYFIGSIPDAAAIMSRAAANDGKCFGNEVFNVKLEFDYSDSNPPPLFGAKYHFHLEGVVDCPEFLVHFPTLVRLAENYGLELVEKSTFSEFFKEHVAKGKFLLQRMFALETYSGEEGAWKKDSYSAANSFLSSNRDVTCVGTMSTQEWEVASLYMVFAFKKVRKLS